MTQKKHNINDRIPTYKETKQQQAKQTQQEKKRFEWQINRHVQGMTVKKALDNLSSLEKLPNHTEKLLKTNRPNQKNNKSYIP